MVIVIQVLIRIWLTRLGDQVKAKNIYVVSGFVLTAVQWAVIIYCERAHGYAVISDTPLCLLLKCIQIILQGTFLGSIASYRVGITFLTYPIFAPIVAAHLYMHEPPPGHQLLMRKREFLGVFLFIMTIICLISVINTHTRRIHLAELAGLAEHYQRQRDRLHYDVVYSGSSARASRRDGSAGASESDEGLLEGQRPRPAPSSTYGSNSELNFSEPDDSWNAEREGDAALTEVGCNGSPAVRDMLSAKAQERDAVLWSTLESMGIKPKEHAHLD